MSDRGIQASQAENLINGRVELEGTIRRLVALAEVQANVFMLPA